METITNTAELKQAILLLEQEHALQGQLLREECLIAYQNLKPANIFKNMLSELTSSGNLKEQLIATALGMIGGSLLGKVNAGSSPNGFQRIIRSLIQNFVARIVAQNPDVLKKLGHAIIQLLFNRKNQENPEERDRN